MKRVLWSRCLLVIAGILSPLALVSNLAVAHAVTPGNCTTEQLSVALAPGQPANQTIQGTLCNPLLFQGAHTVDVLVHGATYNSSYWNFPIETNSYSYVDDTLLVGRATFAYDQIGAGQSSHPVSTDITIESQGFILHQVLNFLRGTNQYTKFNVIGHSLGSVTALDEAATYNDENGLILTGFSNVLSPAAGVALSQDLYPANQDPQFAGKNLDSGYITTVPGTRSPLFYSSIADPAIIAYDEAHKDTSTVSVETSGVPLFSGPAATNISQNITVPILDVVGQQDAIFFCNAASPSPCNSDGALQSTESPYFTHASSFTARTIPLTGHDLALHPTNPLTFAIIDGWISTH